jgi:hypothetical protein
MINPLSGLKARSYWVKWVLWRAGRLEGLCPFDGIDAKLVCTQQKGDLNKKGHAHRYKIARLVYLIDVANHNK